MVDEFAVPDTGISRVGFVLSGGGSRGAYEVGVLQYLRNDFPKVFGKHVNLDVVTGTSVGAINTAFIAASAEDPSTQGDRLAALWRSLRIEELLALKIDLRQVLRLLVNRAPLPPAPGTFRYGGLVDTTGLERVVVRQIPWRHIDQNLRKRHLRALSVSTTHVASGHTVVFVSSADYVPATWSRDPFVRHREARIGPRHVLASAALPLLFPSVKIGDDFYSDGGLRQNTPLSPALRLGANKLLLVSLRHVADGTQVDSAPVSYPSPLFLLGKTLNALLLDHTEYDVDRLLRINAIIDAGERAFGPQFAPMMNAEMEKLRGGRFKKIDLVHIRPSFDIGEVATEFVTKGRARVRSKLANRIISRLAAGESERENDLLSYLLFDGDYAAELIAMGRRDAARYESELVRLFSS